MVARTTFVGIILVKATVSTFCVFVYKQKLNINIINSYQFYVAHQKHVYYYCSNSMDLFYYNRNKNCI